MARLRNTIPKEFEDLIEAGDEAAAREMFSHCEPQAVASTYVQHNALGFRGLSPQMMRWLVDQGVDVNGQHRFGLTPLGEHASRGAAEAMRTLIGLGADVEAGSRTPLFMAAMRQRPKAIEVLIEAGADIHATTLRDKRTALEEALTTSDPIHLPSTLAIVRLLLDAGAVVTDVARKALRRVGQDFESQRDRMSAQSLQRREPALQELYRLTGVEPVAPIRRHDGVSRIEVTATTWKRQYMELWDFLVPAGGPAVTVQGEAIRIIGRIGNEILNNGGGNWDDEYETMLTALEDILTSRRPVADPGRTAMLVHALRGGPFDERSIDALTEQAVEWVLRNPDPLELGTVPYQR